MKSFINGIVKAGFDQWVGFVIIAMLISLCALLITAIAVPKEISCYYLSSSSPGAFPEYRIFANTDWMIDESAFVSNDISETLSVMATLKQCGE